jgi:DNA polymerase-3 subunit delta'
MIYPWQNQQWQQLLSRYQSNRLPHALLFAGAQGLGKFQLAEKFAQLLLCESSNQTACNSCHSCQWLQAQTHPDWFCLTPEEEGKAIKIEQVRELQESLNQTSHGHYKVVLIDPAEAMNRAAANALLKTLEEPPGQVIFLLISNQANLIPATVRSRCQILRFHSPSLQQGCEWLHPQLPQSLSPAALLEISDYSPLRALDLADAKNMEEWSKIITGFLDFLLGKNDFLSLANFYAELNTISVIHYLYNALLDMVRLQLNPEAELKNSQWREKLTIISQQLSLASIYDFLDQLLQLKKHEQEKINLNRQLLWESLFIRLRSKTTANI